MRIKSSIKNLTYAVVGQFSGLIISLIARLVFIQYLGVEYLGLNGFYTNLLSMLSLVELGLGPAMAYSLYRPLASKDTEKIKSLMKLYKKAYISIGLIIILLGLALIPFLDLFLQSNFNSSYTTLIFLLFIINTALSYFYSYKRTLLISDQKRYISTLYKYSFFVLLNIIQILVLVLYEDFIFFLICQIVATLLENVLVSKKVDKLYPFINEHTSSKLDASTIDQLKRNVKAMSMHKMGGAFINSSDNLIISKFLGLIEVGLYSNYFLIINALNIITSQVFSSILASVGNLGVTENDGKKIFVFKVVFFANFWLFSVFSICLIVLVNPFIYLWVGEKYIMDFYIIVILVINFYLMGIRKAVLTFRDALGVYWHDRYKPIFEVLMKVTVSIILVEQLGMVGVFLGTTISTIFTCLWVEPYVLYKYGFKSSVIPYFGRLITYSCITVLLSFLTLGITGTFQQTTGVAFLLSIITSMIVPNALLLLMFYKTPEFKYLFKIVRNIKTYMK